MPFDPNSGAWISGGDQPHHMPSTSAGDIIGGFNSYDTFQQNQAARDLENQLAELSLNANTYKFDRQQHEDSQMDDFRIQAPDMEEAELERAMLSLPDPTSAQNAYIRKTGQQETQRRSQAVQFARQYQRGISDGTLDPSKAADDFITQYPDYADVANALRGMKRDPSRVATQGKTEEQTNKLILEQPNIAKKGDLLDSQIDLTSSRVKTEGVKRQLMQLKVNIAKNLGAVKPGKPMTEAQRTAIQNSIVRLKKGITDFKQKILMEGDMSYEDFVKETNEQVAVFEQRLAAAGNSSAPGQAAPPADQPQGFKPGDKVYDFTKQ